jgi:hypothetical protein
MGNEKSKAGVKGPPSPAPSGVIPATTSTLKASVKAPDEAMIKDVTSKSHCKRSCSLLLVMGIWQLTSLKSPASTPSLTAWHQSKTALPLIGYECLPPTTPLTLLQTLLKEALGRLNEVSYRLSWPAAELLVGRPQELEQFSFRRQTVSYAGQQQ